MKTTVKTITIASIIALGTASAFAKPAARPVEPGKDKGPAPAVKELPNKVVDKNFTRPEHRPEARPESVVKREEPKFDHRHHGKPSARPEFRREHRGNHRPAEFHKVSSKHIPGHGPSVRKSEHRKGPRPSAEARCHRPRHCR